MNNAERIRIAMVKRGNIKEAELARKLNIFPQSLNTRLKKNNFKEEELVKIAEALDCTYISTFKLNDTGEVIS